MSFVPVLEYGFGIGVFGFVGWLLGGVKDTIVAAGIHETGPVWTLMDYGWTGAFIIYLVFGGIWLVRKYNEKEYMGGDLV